jgi:hypothetical protein
MTAAQSTLALDPDQTEALSILCGAAAFNGELKVAHDVDNRLRAIPAALFDEHYCAIDIAAAEGRKAEAVATIDRFAKTADVGAFDLGEQYAIAGDYRKAFTWFDKSYRQKQYVLFLLPNEKNIPAPFFATPEWKAFFRRPLFDDWRRAHDTVAAEIAAR